MSRLTFNGGIHPYEGKELSKDKPMREYLPKGDMVYPISQHIGAPAKIIVAKGDKVLVGQMIAEAGGFVSAPIYSTVSGTVKSIEKHRVPVGDMVESVIIENDGLYEEVEFSQPKALEELTRDEIIALISKAGVVGMGGAGFPTHVKLSPKDPDKIDFVIANCAECEPYLTSDYRRMIEEPQKLIDGMKVELALFPNAKGVFAIEENKPDCIKIMQDLVKDEPRMEVATLITKYPQGAERAIIYAVTKRAINSSQLPADAGCVVNNVDTICAIGRAVLEGRPLMERIVTVTGDAIADPVNFIVRCGTNYNELIEAAGGFVKEPEKIVSGGPMMGFALFDTNVPVTKTSSALLCLSKDEVSANKPSACISCGMCATVCPERLLPMKLATFGAKGNEEAFLKYHGLECVECGCCSFVCPAKRHVTQNIKSMRKVALSHKKK